MKLTKAFTLIELLIVIVIIGILAVSLIPRIIGAQDKARYVRVQKDADNFRIAVYEAQNNTKKPLKDITGTLGTYFSCIVSGQNGLTKADFKNYGPDSACAQRWKLSLRKIEAAAGYDSGSLSYLETDPWGQPYALFEIDGSTAYSADPCAYGFDQLATVGPDGYYYTHNPEGRTNDDRRFQVPGYFCSLKGY